MTRGISDVYQVHQKRSTKPAFQAALKSGAEGSICMKASWKGFSQVGPNQFQWALEMIKRVHSLG